MIEIRIDQETAEELLACFKDVPEAQVLRSKKLSTMLHFLKLDVLREQKKKPTIDVEAWTSKSGKVYKDYAFIVDKMFHLSSDHLSKWLSACMGGTVDKPRLVRLEGSVNFPNELELIDDATNLFLTRTSIGNSIALCLDMRWHIKSDL